MGLWSFLYLASTGQEFLWLWTSFCWPSRKPSKTKAIFIMFLRVFCGICQFNREKSSWFLSRFKNLESLRRIESTLQFFEGVKYYFLDESTSHVWLSCNNLCSQTSGSSSSAFEVLSICSPRPWGSLQRCKAWWGSFFMCLSLDSLGLCFLFVPLTSIQFLKARCTSRILASTFQTLHYRISTCFLYGLQKLALSIVQIYEKILRLYQMHYGFFVWVLGPFQRIE